MPRERVIQTLPVPYCPSCGARMVLRKPRPDQDWAPFWGCSQYPECRGSRNIGPDGKPERDDDDLDGYLNDDWGPAPIDSDDLPY